jgi:hypothetical protein
MGAWGFNNFENDAAADFVWDVKESASGVIKIIHTITESATKPLIEEEAEETLAAIEYIAAAKGNPSEDLTEEAKEFVADNLLHFKQYLVPGFKDEDFDVVDISLKAISRIRDSSELTEQWKESDDYENWLSVLRDLERRVKS